jgi:hypothetical protein
MDWPFFVMAAGFCVSVTALTFFLFGRRRQAPLSAPKARSEGVRELCAAACWGGLVIVQVGMLANDLRFGASSQNLALALPGYAFFALACGFYLGRLSLRRQLRPEADAAR